MTVLRCENLSDVILYKGDNSRIGEIFIRFAASMTAPMASGWSGCRVGLHPLESTACGARQERTFHVVVKPGEPGTTFNPWRKRRDF
jgi:hypothetical protein